MARSLYREAVKIEGAGGGVQAADPIGGGEPCPDGVLLQHVFPQLVGQQGEHPVARVGQGGGDVLLPVGVGAGDGPVPHLGGAGAGPGAVKEIGHALNGGGEHHGLVDRARREGAGEEAVEVRPLVGVVLLQLLGGGRVQRVEGGGGHHAQHLPRLVVVDAHRPLAAGQGLIGDVVVPGVQGEVEVVARPQGGVGPGEQVVAGELVGKGHQRPGADVALGVPHGVEGGLAHGGVVVPAPGAVLLRPGEHVPVPVQHPAHRELSLAVVEVAVGGKGDPAAAIFHEAEHKQAGAQQQGGGQQEAEQGPLFNLLHRPPPIRRWIWGPAPPPGGPPAGRAGGWQSWRSAGCRWP